MMNSLKLLSKYQYNTFSVKAHWKSNFMKIDLWYCRCELQSYFFSCWCWKSRLIFIQMLVINMMDFPRFCQRKVLNLSQVGRTLLLRLIWVFVQLPTEADSILEEQCYKKDAFEACDKGCVKMIFVLLTEVVVFPMWTLIVQVWVANLKGEIAKWRVYLKLAMLLALHK